MGRAFPRAARLGRVSCFPLSRTIRPGLLRRSRQSHQALDNLGMLVRHVGRFGKIFIEVVEFDFVCTKVFGVSPPFDLPPTTGWPGAVSTVPDARRGCRCDRSTCRGYRFSLLPRSRSVWSTPSITRSSGTLKPAEAGERRQEVEGREDGIVDAAGGNLAGPASPGRERGRRLRSPSALPSRNGALLPTAVCLPSSTGCARRFSGSDAVHRSTRRHCRR